MKKVSIIIAIICSSLLCAQVKVDQSTPRAALESCIRAMERCNSSELTLLMPPEKRNKLRPCLQNTEIGQIIGVILTMSTDSPSFKWYFIPTDPAALEKYIRNCLQHKKYFAQVNGKWHVDLRVLFITRSPEDQHEVEQFFCRMVNYAANGNWDVFWQNVTPDARSYMIRECGSLKEVQKLLSSDKQAVQIIKELNDPQIQQQLLPFIIYFLNEGNCLKKIDGKYLLRHPDQQEF